MEDAELRSLPAIRRLDLNLAPLDGSTGPQAVRRTVARDFLANAENYYVAVERLVLPPLPWAFAPLLRTTNQNDPPTRLNCDVSVTWTSAAGVVVASDPQPVLLQRTDMTAAVPQVIAGVLQAQPTDGYASVRSFETLRAMLQQAIQAAWSSCIANAGGAIAGQTQPPALFYDAATGLFTLSVYPYGMWADSDIVNGRMRLYFSAEWLGFLKGWPLQILNTTPTPAGSRLDLLVVMDEPGTTGPAGCVWRDWDAGTSTWIPGPPGQLAPDGINAPIDPATAQLLVTQSFPAAWAWNTWNTVQLLSTLSTETEMTDPPLGQLAAGQNVTTTTQQILADFAIDPSAGGASSWAQPLVYNAGGLADYRYIALNPADKLNQLTLYAETVDREGVRRPLQSSGAPASAKLVFVRRDLVEHWRR